MHLHGVTAMHFHAMHFHGLAPLASRPAEIGAAVALAAAVIAAGGLRYRRRARD